jgi:endonuclease-3
MNVLWGAPMVGVDTHVFRNAHRYGWATDADNTPEKVEEKLLKIVPIKYHGIINHVMVLHGRYICKALRPDCANCAVAMWCDAKDKRLSTE